MRLRVLHITEPGKSHMDLFQEISHICSTAYNTGLLSPYHLLPGLLYPSFKAPLYRHVFFIYLFFAPQSAFPATEVSTKAKLNIKQDEDGPCVIVTCGSLFESSPEAVILTSLLVALSTLIEVVMVQTLWWVVRGWSSKRLDWAAAWHSLGLIDSERV